MNTVAFFRRLTVATLLTLATTPLWAQALPASDNAADPAYSGGFIAGTNGGTGFQPWNFFETGSTGTTGYFIGDSNSNGFGAGPGINVAGEAFGVSANGDRQAFAARRFSDNLGIGQTFSLDFDNGFVDDTGGSRVGFFLADSAGVGRFTFLFIGGQAQYRLIDADGGRSTGVNFTDGGVHIRFTMTSATTYEAEFTRLVNNETITTTGNLASSVDRVTIFNNHAGDDATANIFVNNLQISESPEPASGTILLAGWLMVGGVALYRRKQ